MSAPVINTRSPYYLKVIDTDTLLTLSSVTIDIEVYTGLETAYTGTPNYTLTKDATTASPNYAVFEISELIRDYLYTNYYDASVDCVWVKVDATGVDSAGDAVDVDIDENTSGNQATDYFIAIDGYGDFNEGVNPRTSSDPQAPSHTPMLLQNVRKMYFVKGQELKFPVYAVPEPTVTFSSGLAPVYVSDDGTSGNKIRYITASGGATNNFETGDTITITSTVGNSQTVVLSLEEICEPKYEPIKALFYNKYGAIEEFWMSKKSVKSLSVESDSFKSHTFDYDNLQYDTNRHTVKKYNVNGQKRISASTSYLSERVNPSVEQLLVSENIWLQFATSENISQVYSEVTTYWGDTPRLWLLENEIVPVTIATSDFTEKTSVNDKLIAYTFEFDYAYDKIQNIR